MRTKRALTESDKREAIERLLVAWLNVPEQRFGQLISNARATSPIHGLFSVEDAELADAVERFATRSA